MSLINEEEIGKDMRCKLVSSNTRGVTQFSTITKRLCFSLGWQVAERDISHDHHLVTSCSKDSNSDLNLSDNSSGWTRAANVEESFRGG
ncbi:MAG TPA: hypothetical protein VE870_07125 [Bacteroidales bacterium]|nr:hypothetical protein [Bacteroidales bacterium]